MRTLFTLHFILALCVLLQTSVHAQERENPPKFGVKVGLNHTNMNYNRGYLSVGAVAPDSRPMSSFTGGLILNLPLNGSISIQPEYLYSLRKSYLPALGVINQFHYLSLPVLMHINITKKMSLHAGPQVDLLIHAKKSDGKELTNITHDTEERNLAAVGGIRYSLVKNFFVEGRYLHGISNVGVGQRSNVKEFKYGIFEFTAGIRF